MGSWWFEFKNSLTILICVKIFFKTTCISRQSWIFHVPKCLYVFYKYFYRWNRTKSKKPCHYFITPVLPLSPKIRNMPKCEDTDWACFLERGIFKANNGQSICTWLIFALLFHVARRNDETNWGFHQKSQLFSVFTSSLLSSRWLWAASWSLGKPRKYELDRVGINYCDKHTLSCSVFGSVFSSFFGSFDGKFWDWIWTEQSTSSPIPCRQLYTWSNSVY